MVFQGFDNTDPYFKLSADTI